jgi:hypothetical protein
MPRQGRLFCVEFLYATYPNWGQGLPSMTALSLSIRGPGLRSRAERSVVGTLLRQEITSYPHSSRRPWRPQSLLHDGCRAHFTGLKQPGRDTDNTHPSSSEVTNECKYTYVPPLCLHGILHGDHCLYLVSPHKNSPWSAYALSHCMSGVKWGSEFSFAASHHKIHLQSLLVKAALLFWKLLKFLNRYISMTVMH